MRRASTFEAGEIRHGEFVIIFIIWKVIWVDVDEICFAEVGNAEFSKDVIDDGGSEFDGTVSGDGAGGFEASEDEGVDVFFERDAVLQTEADGDGEAVHEASESGAFFMHIDEDFAE